MVVRTGRPGDEWMKRSMTEPSLRLLPLKHFITAAVLLSAVGCAAWSYGPWTNPKAPVRLEDGHFHDGVTGRDVPARAVIERLAEADVVFLGEVHEIPSHRAFQVALLKGLTERAPGLALGLEFFSREDQPFLDDLASGRISELALRSFVRRADVCPYRELIALARRRGIRLLGLNLPRRVTARVARDGWESLSPGERARWPKPTEASSAYRRLVRKAYLDFQGHHKSAYQRFLAAQTLWDSTMAESIHRHLEAGQSKPLVVVVGVLHVAYGLGIPARLNGRKGASSVIVLHSEALEEKTEGPERSIADYIWYPDRSAVASASHWSDNLIRGVRAP